MKKNIYILAIFFLANFTFSCSNENKDTHEDEHHDHHEEDSREVSLSPTQQASIQLELAPLQKRLLGESIELTGRLESPPQMKASISPILNGFVRKVMVIEGDQVKKGETLAILEHPDYITLQQQYLEQFNNLNFLEKEYARKKKLYEQEVGSGKEFQRITSEYQSTKAMFQALKAQLQLLGIRSTEVEKGNIASQVYIRSSINGFIDKVNVNLGVFVNAADPMFEVVNLEHLHADFNVFEKDLGKIQKGDEIILSVSSRPNKTYKAEVHEVASTFDEANKSSLIHAHFIDDFTGLVPGMYVVGHLITNGKEILSIPTEAIVKKNGKSFIFFKEEHQHKEEKVEIAQGEHGHEHEEGSINYKMVEVVTGISALGYTEISLMDKVDTHAQAVHKGAYWLIAEQGKAATAHEH